MAPASLRSTCHTSSIVSIRSIRRAKSQPRASREAAWVCRLSRPSSSGTAGRFPYPALWARARSSRSFFQSPDPSALSPLPFALSPCSKPPPHSYAWPDQEHAIAAYGERQHPNFRYERHLSSQIDRRLGSERETAPVLGVGGPSRDQDCCWRWKRDWQRCARADQRGRERQNSREVI